MNLTLVSRQWVKAGAHGHLSGTYSESPKLEDVEGCQATEPIDLLAISHQLSNKLRASKWNTVMKTLPLEDTRLACSPRPHSSMIAPRNHGARPDFASRPSPHSGARHRKRGDRYLGWQPAQTGQNAAFKGAGQFSLQQQDEGISAFWPPHILVLFMSSASCIPTNV